MSQEGTLISCAGSSTRQEEAEVGVMAEEKEDFNSIGPTHLTVVDWDDDNHRRSVAAALVGGVYILERDREEKRHGKQALAPLWWEYFHFRLLRPLLDDVDNSIFGAIFEYELKSCPGVNNSSNKGIPHYIIALRGTLTKGDAFSRDLQLDLHLIQNGLHKTSRVAIALRAVRDTAAGAHNMNVWLAGHSLGAAMAMAVGKTMASGSVHLESFLFNPPFFSAPVEKIKDEKVKHGIRIAGSVVTAGLALAMSVKRPQNRAPLALGSANENFTGLSRWVPGLFVHPDDHVCSGYIGYFMNRRKMEEIGVGGISRLASQHSLGGLVMSALGKETEPALHLIPSACLTVNRRPAPDFKKAHGLRQWWMPNLQLETEIHLYK